MEEPPRLGLRERLLIEWVAQASVGDPFPEPWRHARDPPESIIRTLVELGVMARPAPDTRPDEIARGARDAARAWLEEHPA